MDSKCMLKVGKRLTTQLIVTDGSMMIKKNVTLHIHTADSFKEKNV